MDFINHTIALADAPSTNYIVVPYRCVILGADCASDFEAGDDSTVVLYNDSTAQVSFALAATSLGVKCAGTLNATTIFEKGDLIKIVASDDAGSATGNVNITIKIDPFLSGVAGT
jgi:hypothetical protein